MTLDQFHNALRVLTSIDRHELQDAGIINVPKGQDVYPGCMDEPNRIWERFQSDPFRFFIRAGDETAEKLWRLIERRCAPKHIHVAGTTIGKDIDECARCGRDLRDPIHARM